MASMDPARLLMLTGICLAAFWACAHAHAETYEWLDDRGVLTRSNALPPPDSYFRELRVVPGTAELTPAERRTLEIINEEARTSVPTMSSLPSESVGFAESAPVAADVSTATSVSPAAENTRDPCLLSWDPACHAKHAAQYDPRWGYAPSLLGVHRELRQASP